jgi:hypothetical protein
MDRPADPTVTGRTTPPRRSADWQSSSVVWAIVGLVVIAVIAWLAFGALAPDPTLTTDPALQEPAEAPAGTAGDDTGTADTGTGTAADTGAAGVGEPADTTDPAVVADPLDATESGTDGEPDAGVGATTGEDGTPAGE